MLRATRDIPLPDFAGLRRNGKSPAEAGLFRTCDELCADRIDRDETADLATVLKADHAINLGEEGVVLAAAYVYAGLERCPALTDENGAAGDGFAAEALDAEPLCI